MRARRLLALALAAVALSACGTVRAGAAATVGDERITTSQLNAYVERGLSDPSASQTVGGDRPGFERSVLSRLIQHLVLTQAAQAEQVSIDETTIDKAVDTFAAQLGGEAQLRQEALKAGISAKDLRPAIADSALREALADKLTAGLAVPEAALRQAYQDSIAQYDQVHSAHILVKTLAQANSILAQVRRNPSAFASLAARFSEDTSNKNTGGDLGFQGRGALEKPFEDAIFAARPGTFVVAHTSFGFHVIHVIARRTTTLAQATPELRRNLLATPRGQLVRALLAKTAKKLGVHVNPRFGTFDAVTEEVNAPVVCPATAISSPSPRADDSTAPAPTASPAC